MAAYLHDRTQFVKVGDASTLVTDITAGVPQGSVLGPLLFTAYVSPVARLIDSFAVNHISYADDFTLYVNLGHDVGDARRRLRECAAVVSNWFMFNDLLLNPSKSEVLAVGTKVQLKRGVVSESIAIAGAQVNIKNHMKIMGVTLDIALNFDKHVSDVVSSTSFHLRALKHVRKAIDKSTANTIACSIIGSRLDYCNSALAGISNHNVKRLQRVQNSAARTVANAHGRCSVSAIMKDLHWLPIDKRIDYKVALTTFKLLSTSQPKYLRTVLNLPVAVRPLRSANCKLLDIPFSKTVFCSRAFSSYAPRLWNNLLQSLRDSVGTDMCSGAVSVDSFKSRLKTVLFRDAYFAVA